MGVEFQARGRKTYEVLLAEMAGDKGVPARESRTGSRLVSPVEGREKKKWTPLKQSLGTQIEYSRKYY